MKLNLENSLGHLIRKNKKIVTELIVVAILITAAFTLNNVMGKVSNSDRKNTGEVTEASNNNTSGKGGNPSNATEPTLSEEEQEKLEQERKENEKLAQVEGILKEAKRLAMGYDYDGAIQVIKDFQGDYRLYDKLTAAIEEYEAAKTNLDPFGAYDSPSQISHIFFHSLIADTSLAFDKERDANGYNYYMTTMGEFNEMMKQMYEAGYVLVSIHDVGKKVTLEDGSTKFVAGDIMLPPDKKPFVLSQDDVNYYDYMDGDGFATRIVIDENGRPSTEMILADGSVSIGDFDMVPALETFIEQHPDFSYKGARGILAVTGYEGTLGYRTDDKNSPTYEQDREKVKEVAKVLKEWGWEFASHSYGHRNMFEMSTGFIIKDTDRWMKEVGELIGPTDIFIYPYGVEIEKTFDTYSNDKYKYLKSLGFEYYCGVYKEPWLHIKDEYVRMTRRPLDGQAMLQFPERLSDLFDVSTVIDKTRPELK